MNDKIEAIKNLSDEVGVLYVEDNEGLSKNMQTLLKKIFNDVYIAHDGVEGYKEYIRHRPKIVITDINMPKLNGFAMIKKIKTTEPTCKIIILSAYDEKSNLYAAINSGVFRYLHKPAKIPELIDALYDAIISINKEKDSNIFMTQLQSIFNYQNNIVIMMHKNRFILANKRFDEFFGVTNLDEFFDDHKDIDKLLLEHKEFLYSDSSSHWVNTAIENPGKLFHTKIENYIHEKRHLILKLRKIPEKDEHYILSFDDVTELNLMALFDLDAAKNDATSKDKMSILSLLRVIKDNSSEVKIHNFYRGLTIINPAVIIEINNESFTLKTVNTQLKVIRLVKLMTITSEIFPKDVICKSIKNIDSDNQTIVVDDISFATRSVADRQYIRLEPDMNHVSTLYYKNIKLPGETSIMDISEVSVKLKITALPAGIEIGTKVKLFISLKLKGKLISFSNIEASVYRIDENKRDYNLVLLYELDKKNIDNLRDYLANRQIELIREFKSIDINAQVEHHYSI